MTPHLSTILFGNLAINSQQRILGCYISFAELRFWPLQPVSQHKYVIDLLSKHNTLDSKLVFILLVVGTSLTANDGTASVNATLYCQVVGGLQHLQMNQPDISFSMNKLSQFMHA